VNVGGNTDLQGAVIASNQSAVDAGKYSFTTGGTLTTSDIQNSANYSASSTSVGVDGDKGRASSTTTAGFSGIAGDKSFRGTGADT
jgi:filamentous hemagglutinin